MAEYLRVADPRFTAMNEVVAKTAGSLAKIAGKLFQNNLADSTRLRRVSE
jgi:hypothetical protein